MMKLRRIVQGSRMDVLHASVHAMRHVLEKGRPSALLLDADMEKGIALEAVRYIKAAQPDLPIMLVSSSSYIPKDLFSRWGIDGALYGPFVRNTVISLINKVIDGKERWYGYRQ
ncbi:MAG: response regulator [Candidatus Omnitrophica bacterium]|nr:response regulator [Candidatus Omnitrophota bacterium]